MCGTSTEVTLILDCTLSSPLLKSKIADLPSKHKIKLITFPLLNSRYNEDDIQLIDVVRDKKYIVKQLVDYADLHYYTFLETIPNYFNLWHDETFALSFLDKLDDYDFRHFANNRDFLLRAVTECVNGVNLLKYSDERLLNDKDFMMEIVKRKGNAVSFVSDSLKKDRDIALAAVTQDGGAILEIDSNLRQQFIQDREVMLHVVKSYGMAIQLAPEELQEDREIVALALQQDGALLKDVHPKFWNDREIVLMAVQNNGLAITYASEKLQLDKEIILCAVKSNGYSLGCIDKQLRNDRNLILEAFKTSLDHSNDDAIYEMVDEKFRDDKDIALAAIRQGYSNFEFLSDHLKQDREIILQCLKTNFFNFKLLDSKFKEDKEIILEAIRSESISYSEVESNMLQNDKDVVLAAIKYDSLFEEIPEELTADRDFILSAIETVPKSLIHVLEELKYDRLLIQEAIRSEAAFFKRETPVKIYNHVSDCCGSSICTLKSIVWDEELLNFARQEYDYLSFLLDLPKDDIEYCDF